MDWNHGKGSCNFWYDVVHGTKRAFIGGLGFSGKWKEQAG